MFRFTDLTRAGETVREVRQKHPETEEVFERYGIRPACYDCSIGQASMKVGVPVVDLLLEIDQAVYRAAHLAA